MSNTLTAPIGFGREPKIIAALSVPISNGVIDFDCFAEDLERTASYGIEPAVLMDTYQINHCTVEQQVRGLEVTRDVMAGRPFTAGVYVEDEVAGDGPEHIALNDFNGDGNGDVLVGRPALMGTRAGGAVVVLGPVTSPLCNPASEFIFRLLFIKPA